MCDGSFNPCLFKKGTSAAWVIDNDDQSECISGKVDIAGIKADAYRGELLGIYTMLTANGLIETRCVHYSTGTLNIGCDNKTAGWLSGKPSQRVSLHRNMWTY